MFCNRIVGIGGNHAHYSILSAFSADDVLNASSKGVWSVVTLFFLFEIGNDCKLCEPKAKLQIHSALYDFLVVLVFERVNPLRTVPFYKFLHSLAVQLLPFSINNNLCVACDAFPV